MWARQRISGQAGTGLVPLTLAPVRSGFRQYSELIHPFFSEQGTSTAESAPGGMVNGHELKIPFWL